MTKDHCFFILLEYQELEKETKSGGKRLLKIPKSKCKTFLGRSFAISGPKLWNKLPAAIKNLQHSQN